MELLTILILDLDNDGIINSFESRGNGVFNFTDLYNPIINLENENSPIMDIASLSIVEDRADTHDRTESNDRFTSEIKPGADGQVDFNFTFSEKINILIVDSDTEITAVDGESFLNK